MTIALSIQAAQAVLDEMQRGKVELSILLGSIATDAEVSSDAESVRDHILKALTGRLPKIEAACLRHVDGVMTTEIDVGLMERLGVCVPIVAFLAMAMGVFTVRADGHTLVVAAPKYNNGPNYLCVDIALGGGAQWSCQHDQHELMLPQLPETMLVAIAGRADDGTMPLTTILTHPLLDAHDLHISGIELATANTTVVGIAEVPGTARRPLAELRGH